ncbi:hypothetical protein PGT21_026673 [Puccinia graminis f. sp. tritici]|uniref:Uncharacterized protein n=1 Tax=Puccinia graminis f. sp. tritici TaxID=56615 RepID=A0A5B0NK40_PUCGR|nr:hypothetical protein PGT21_026673 [Puccinia graminis f. sp. tritici]
MFERSIGLKVSGRVEKPDCSLLQVGWEHCISLRPLHCLLLEAGRVGQYYYFLLPQSRLMRKYIGAAAPGYNSASDGTCFGETTMSNVLL